MYCDSVDFVCFSCFLMAFGALKTGFKFDDFSWRPEGGPKHPKAEDSWPGSGNVLVLASLR